MNTNTHKCRFINPYGFQKMHNIMKAWNDSIHLGIYMECCYGGGIQKGVQRNILRNGLPQNPSDLFDDIDDVWFFISTLATHVDYGYGDRMSFLPHVLNNIYTSISKPSYMELSNNINERVQNLKQNIFREISIFYHENFNTMYYLLPDEQAKENWLLTHDLIEEDLENLGRCYFASQDWKKTGDDFNMSDNYFHGIAKKIPIHSGFVGFMTNLLLNASYCPYSRQFEPFFKHGFTPYTGNGELNEIPNEQPGTDIPIDIEDVEEMTTLSNKIRLLNNNIRTYYDNNFSGNYGYTYNPIFSILEPTMKCFGQFTKTSA